MKDSGAEREREKKNGEEETVISTWCLNNIAAWPVLGSSELQSNVTYKK